MEIKNRRVLVLGGWGLVGMAVLRKLLEEKPKEVVVSSLYEKEAKEAVEILKNEYPNAKIAPVWGNVFVRKSMKDLSRNEILENKDNRRQLVTDVMEPLTSDMIEVSFLNRIIGTYNPHIIIDTINTATALAYGDIYERYFNLKNELNRAQNTESNNDNVREEIEKLIATLYIPQIIRHIQILYMAMVTAETKLYLKIGTSGTGGMGLNIPYTHSEERPSSVLLSKSSLAGAHSLLLFLMGRTPDGPIIKEIKPATAIAWKSIEYGTVVKKNQPVHLFDCPPENGELLSDIFLFEGQNNWKDLGRDFKSVYIDTGENGIFSRAEFETLTTIGQMEFVTPEEIATNVIMEIIGDSTGHDIINALDNSIMGPSYRAGYMRESAIRQMEMLMEDKECDSIAFELLGPPRLSKLLHEANLLKRVCTSLKYAAEVDIEDLVGEMERIIRDNEELRSQILSIGIPILMGDGKTLLRGPQLEIPVSRSRKQIPVTSEKINRWAEDGWIDLRKSNIEFWQSRIKQIIDLANQIPSGDTSSQFHHGKEYWAINAPINIGKLAAWIFINEDKGMRIKE